MLEVDGEIAFISGLCVGRMWEGDAAHGIEPWRDTGIEIHGPAVGDVTLAFARTWALTGSPLPDDRTPSLQQSVGDVGMRIVATEPATADMLRLDNLVAALARKRLWLTDAYYAGTTLYVQALKAAAEDGVDVRLLVPNATDLPLVRPLSRAGYRPLLEAGVRVFEWNGTMLHAKTAVADGRWARVGSTNLNIASWLGNCELDAMVEDDAFAARMEEMYERDLRNATEVILDDRRRMRTPGEPRHKAAPRPGPPPQRRRQHQPRRGRCGADRTDDRRRIRPSSRPGTGRGTAGDCLRSCNLRSFAPLRRLSPRPGVPAGRLRDMVWRRARIPGVAMARRSERARTVSRVLVDRVPNP
jgi:cardiolipin synthase